MMSAPSETRSSAQPHRCMTSATSPSTSGTDAATMTPTRQPRNSSDTASTMASASRNERSNSHTDSATTFGWSAYFSIVTPTGSAALISSSFASRSLPSARVLPLRTIVTPIASAAAPLWRTLNEGGSS